MQSLIIHKDSLVYWEVHATKAYVHIADVLELQIIASLCLLDGTGLTLGIHFCAALRLGKIGDSR